MTRTLIILALAAAAHPASAQASPTLAERADRVRRLAAARDSVYGAWSAMRRTQPDDTLRAGPLTAIVSGTVSRAIEDGLRITADTVVRLLGPDVALIGPIRISSDGGTSGWRGGMPVVTLWSRSTAFDVREALLGAVSQYLAERAGGNIAEWAQPSLGTAPGELFRTTYIDLVTAPSGAAARCFLGELDRCPYALAMVAHPDPRLVYDSIGRRTAALRVGSAGSQRGYRLRNECVLFANDQACLGLLDSLTVLPSPTGAIAREAVLFTMMDLGGMGVWSRLAADTTGSIEDRLVRAAGVDADSLWTRFRTLVSASQPQPASRHAARVLAVLWVFALGGLSLRSTRWR